MTLNQAKELMKQFYDSAMFFITERERDLYEDGVMDRFLDKCDAIVTACIWTNSSDKVWRKAQEYKFELEDKLTGNWYGMK